MITFFSTLLGFLGAAFPDFIKLFRDREDRKHELAVMDRQIQLQTQGHTQRLEEIRIQAEGQEQQSLYQTYQVGVAWVDALNGTVRPMLAYSFFLLYAFVKLGQFLALAPGEAHSLWNEEDQAIFAGIISFYYGSRAFSKIKRNNNLT